MSSQNVIADETDEEYYYRIMARRMLFASICGEYPEEAAFVAVKLTRPKAQSDRKTLDSRTA